LSRKIIENLSFVPGESQLKALELLDEFIHSDDKYFILKGYAGTGKTTLLKALIDTLIWNGVLFALCAPTGRAAKVISEKTGMRASTIHRMIYSYANLSSYNDENGEDLSGIRFYFALRKNIELHDAIIIVDESSMISGSYNDNGYIRFGSGKLLSDLLKYIDPMANNNKIIFIGDSAQLPPVKSVVSAALSEKYLKENFGIEDVIITELREVFRQQSDSGILNNATKIRDSIIRHDFNVFSIRQNPEEVIKLEESNFIEEYFNLIDKDHDRLNDNIIISYSNKKAFKYNHTIRDHIFPKARKKKTKSEHFEGPIREIVAGDILIISKNCYLYQESIDDEGNVTYNPVDLYNGEFVKVLDVEPILSDDRKNVLVRGEDRSVYVNLTFRNIVIGFKDYSGNDLSIKVKIIENFLDSPDPAMSMEHYKALFFEFKERFVRENLGKLEELRRKSKRFKDIEDTDLFKQAIKKDPYFNALLVKYGYAVTCHKAQGGEWKNVFVDFSGFAGLGSELFFRWAYTALTRAKEKLFYLHAPDFYMDEPVQQKVNYRIDPGLSLPVIAAEESICNFRFPENKLFLKNIFNEILNKIKDHEIEIDNIEHKRNVERYFFSDVNGEAVIDFRYDIIGKVTEVKVIMAGNYSKELAEKLMDLYHSEKNHSESILELQTRLKFPESKEFLKDLFYFLYEKLAPENICFHSIEHKSNLERYYFRRDNSIAVLDFCFDNKNSFIDMRENKTNSPELIELIKGLINDGV
jgi:hypothetical protein